MNLTYPITYYVKGKHMSGTTKGYTLQYFINLFTTTTSRQLNTNGVYSVASPRRGVNSVRADVLDLWLGNHTTAIVNGTGSFAKFGKSSRARLLKALSNRKNTGSVYG
jgi:hypothetical protein